MVWVRRLIVLAVIAAGYFGYTLWHDWYEAKRAAEEDRNALLTARVWVATATYRNDDSAFVAWRDSMLAAEGVTRDELYEFLDRYNGREEQFLAFATQVKEYVDSLSEVADSTRTAKFIPVDSTTPSNSPDTLQPK